MGYIGEQAKGDGGWGDIAKKLDEAVFRAKVGIMRRRRLFIWWAREGSDRLGDSLRATKCQDEHGYLGYLNYIILGLNTIQPRQQFHGGIISGLTSQLIVPMWKRCLAIIPLQASYAYSCYWQVNIALAHIKHENLHWYSYLVYLPYINILTVSPLLKAQQLH